MDIHPRIQAVSVGDRTMISEDDHYVQVRSLLLSRDRTGTISVLSPRDKDRTYVRSLV